MMKAPPAGRLVAPVTGRPWQSTGPPTVAAAPLNISPKNGSTGVSWLHAATKSGEYKYSANPHILQNTVVDTLVGRAAPKLNLGRVGGLLEGEPWKSILQKVGAEERGPATRCENQLQCKAVPFR